MKIGIDARMIFYTGIGRHVYNLLMRVAVLSPADEFVIFIRPQDENKLGELFENQKNIKVVKTINTIYDKAEQTEHRKIIESEHLDLLHVPHFNAPIAYKGKLLVTIHDLIQAHFPSQNNLKAKIKKIGYEFIISRALKKAEQIIAVSKYTKKDIIKTFKIPEEKIDVIYNGVDEKWQRKDFPHERTEGVLNYYGLTQPFLLYVGLSSPHKNLLRLIEAMSLVLRTTPEADSAESDKAEKIQLAIVGKKDQRYLDDMLAKIKKLDLEDSIKILGFVPDEDLLVLYNTAKAFVFPSLYEGFGLPPLEALQTGLPVLSSNATCLPEILGYAVTYFDPNDVNDIATQINEFLAHPQRSTPTSVPQYSWDVMVRKTLELYHNFKQKT